MRSRDGVYLWAQVLSLREEREIERQINKGNPFNPDTGFHTNVLPLLEAWGTTPPPQFPSIQAAFSQNETRRGPSQETPVPLLTQPTVPRPNREALRAFTRQTKYIAKFEVFSKGWNRWSGGRATYVVVLRCEAATPEQARWTELCSWLCYQNITSVSRWNARQIFILYSR